MSLHRSARGAYIAMKNHRIDNFNKWRNLPNEHRKDFKETFGQDWMVQSIEVQD